MANPLENVCEKLTHIHMVVYTWWCWHICKGEEVGDEKELVALVAELPDKSGIWRGTQRPDASGRHTGHVRCESANTVFGGIVDRTLAASGPE